MYFKQCRSVLELAVPVWTAGLSKKDNVLLERVQKTALVIVLGKAYSGYKNALEYLNVKTLKERRNDLCLNFAKKKAAKSEKCQHWFLKSAAVPTVNTRSDKPKNNYKEVPTRTDRYKDSPLPFLTKLLNSNMYHTTMNHQNVTNG